jgi:hypothetical protein
MVSSHMVEVAGMNTVEEHEHPMNHRSEVEGMDREDNGMRGMMVEVKMVERECEDVVLVRYWTGNGAATSSSEVRGACEIRVFKRSHHVCMSGLQLFDMA